MTSALPNRTNSPTTHVKIHDKQVWSLWLTVDEYPDGSPGAIFITVGKQGEMINAFMDAFAISVSIALQNGTPLEALVRRFILTKSDPSGVVEGHDRIKMCTSIHDFIFRHLAIEYLGMEDLAHASS